MSTEGFDLDAISESQPGEDIVYELGGGATVTKQKTKNDTSSTSTATKPSSDSKEEEVDPSILKAESLKQQGNEYFKQGAYLDAIDLYADAIEATPGMTCEEILDLQKQHEVQEREKANQRYERDSNRRIASRQSTDEAQDSTNESQESDQDDDLAPQEFVLPPHQYGKYLAVYLSNKAASHIQLEQYSDALECCNVAILVNPLYPKAYIRRMSCHERSDDVNLALADAKKALELSPQNREIKKHVKRLEKLEAERMEKLKEETMGKLKDLGNSILSNFGMSLDNFKAEKDPNTGSYSINMV